ncbi:C4-dicarboxylate ABC transporter [Alkalilimnicola ehrlichii]|uniref:C4-dicarboxylate ABC transporter n=1 Tax=Alkalilimnicola ehrlichii TaxID=351052 RepID=A0A3E0WQB0_9GAMM|nr:TRAP transporter permease [Alkalilimnicola ehrlichii]RFA27271.1 C4-dicarboxylate ABC transporter [Alkalilimnicola ehrlichii]RFA34383.1 C4-dicarboxylate ABC transporter [Alkalilimnicola ehrlichii]
MTDKQDSTLNIRPDDDAERLAEEQFALRYRVLPLHWRVVLMAITVGMIVLATNQIFNLGFFVGKIILDERYLYIYTGAILTMVFITFPAWKGAPKDRVVWYDLLIILAIIGVFGYFAYNAERIVLQAWEYAAPDIGIYLAVVGWALVLEAGRRAGGMPIFVVTFILSLYPLYADKMPQVIAGVGMSFTDAATFHLLSAESVFGIPMQVAAVLLFGFLLFGVSLQHTGAGRFFIQLAFALLGRFRGGPAKVAIFSSGLMGSMSGGPVSNVLTTGPLSIPAMRRVGFSRGYAAGVEACASTGGVLMPPIMGATAFVMANFLGVSYTDIIIAAIIPSLLYFFGLFMQIDAYAARHNLKGLPREELPAVGKVFKEGWYFIAVFVLLIWMLIYLQREATAPFYATVALLVINQLTQHRLSVKGFLELLKSVGQVLAELGGILAAIGLIVGSLQVTGMAGTLTNDLVFLAGDKVLLLLIMGAVTSFVLGIGMTVTAAYIFLAIILAPALIRAGLDPVASHMFIMYWGMLSFITPPVALAAFVAASVARVSAMRAGFEAMRLGTIIYFIPFFFVFNPALVMQGEPLETVLLLMTALIGIVLLSAGLQGYLLGIGNPGSGPLAWIARGAWAVSGLLLAAPLGLMALVLSVIIAILGSVAAIVNRRQAVGPPLVSQS